MRAFSTLAHFARPSEHRRPSWPPLDLTADRRTRETGGSTYKDDGCLRSRRPSARRRLRDVDHRHPFFLVVPAVEALDARHFDVVGAEEARHVQRRRLVGLPDARGPFLALVERTDADHLSLLVVVEVRARLTTQAQRGRDGRWQTDQTRLNDRRGRGTL